MKGSQINHKFSAEYFKTRTWRVRTAHCTWQPNKELRFLLPGPNNFHWTLQGQHGLPEINSCDVLYIMHQPPSIYAASLRSALQTSNNDNSASSEKDFTWAVTKKTECMQKLRIHRISFYWTVMILLATWNKLNVPALWYVWQPTIANDRCRKRERNIHQLLWTGDSRDTYETQIHTYVLTPSWEANWFCS
jgi:hypothetical protein